MQVWPIGKLSAVTHESNDFSRINKCTNFFIKFGIVLIDRNEVCTVLNHYHVSCILGPGGEQHSPIRDTFDRFVGLGYNVNSVMTLFHIVAIGYKSRYG